ncbi:hypothetical protein [Bradyrhizobium sp. ISRA463]|uniref:hypothetical protein n=1 Tax=Bradyrhizobium sp. ISRA463 TaxID=2866199 RepID=UPI002478E7E4|nr:hypothetical protein [Bradyrhizobium sp. ISRA463]WGS21409.1 hypothetical protein MTX22_06670 [Bradyrhizobium sp. ISRA463]
MRQTRATAAPRPSIPAIWIGGFNIVVALAVGPAAVATNRKNTVLKTRDDASDVWLRRH